MFKRFEGYCVAAYNALRRQGARDLLITLFSLMTSCGIPELQTKEDIDWMRIHMMPQLSDEDASKHFVSEIHANIRMKSVQVDDSAHMFAHFT